MPSKTKKTISSPSARSRTRNDTRRNEFIAQVHQDNDRRAYRLDRAHAENRSPFGCRSASAERRRRNSRRGSFDGPCIEQLCTFDDGDNFTYYCRLGQNCPFRFPVNVINEISLDDLVYGLPESSGTFIYHEAPVSFNVCPPCPDAATCPRSFDHSDAPFPENFHRFAARLNAPTDSSAGPQTIRLAPACDGCSAEDDCSMSNCLWISEGIDSCGTHKPHTSSCDRHSRLCHWRHRRGCYHCKLLCPEDCMSKCCLPDAAVAPLLKRRLVVQGHVSDLDQDAVNTNINISPNVAHVQPPSAFLMETRRWIYIVALALSVAFACVAILHTQQ